MKFVVYLMENAIKKAEENGTGKVCVIWDREGFQPKNKDPRFLELFKGLIGLMQDMYAERLHQYFIMHPSIIMKGMFRVVRVFLSKKV